MVNKKHTKNPCFFGTTEAIALTLCAIFVLCDKLFSFALKLSLQDKRRNPPNDESFVGCAPLLRAPFFLLFRFV